MNAIHCEIQVIRLIVIGASLSLSCSASANLLTEVSASLSSDRLYHGLTETSENPSLNVNVGIHGERWFGGISASVARPDRKVERHHPVTFFVGLEKPLADTNWTLSGVWLNRTFIDANKEWDYGEFSVQLRAPGGFAATLDYAPNYYAHNLEALVLQFSQFHEFSSQWYGLATVGYAALSKESDYALGTLATGWTWNSNTAELAFDWHTLGQETRFRDPIQPNRLRLSLTKHLY